MSNFDPGHCTSAVAGASDRHLIHCWSDHERAWPSAPPELTSEAAQWDDSTSSGPAIRSQARAPFAGTVRAGIRGGLTGAVLIRVYEALVSVGAQHPMPLALVVKRSFAPQPYGRA